MSDIVGRIFGRLEVIGDSGNRHNGKIVWDCVCECGKKTTATRNFLKYGRKKSCGCLKTEVLSRMRRTSMYDKILRSEI